MRVHPLLAGTITGLLAALTVHVCSSQGLFLWLDSQGAQTETIIQGMFDAVGLIIGFMLGWLAAAEARA